MTEKEDSVLLGPQAEVDFTPDLSPEGLEYEPTEEQVFEDIQRKNEEAIQKKARLYYLVFTSPDGKAVYDDMTVAYMHRVSLDEDSPDPYRMAFYEGQRSVLLQIMALMQVGESAA